MYWYQNIYTNGIINYWSFLLHSSRNIAKKNIKVSDGPKSKRKEIEWCKWFELSSMIMHQMDITSQEGDVNVWLKYFW